MKTEALSAGSEFEPAKERHKPKSRRRESNESGEPSQNCILRMSDEKTMQLVELYEKEECLWNTQLADYKNRERRSKAAENIAKALDIPHFEARHVVIKFKNLRNSYCQELKKIAHSIDSGVGPEEVYRPKVFWFSKMHSFLRPHLQPARNCMPHMVIPADLQLDEVKKEPSAEEECWVQMTDPEDVLIPDASMESGHSASEEEKPCSCSSKKGRKRKYSSANADSPEDVASKILKEISAKLHLLNNEEDYYDNFGKYIAALLRSLPKQRAFHLQPRIISLITNEGLPQDSERVSQSDEVNKR